MIVIRSERQTAEILRRAREYRGYSESEIARRLFIDRRTVRGRDAGEQAYTLAALIQTAQLYGYAVALIPLDRTEAAA